MLILQDAQLKIRLPSDLKQKIEEVANQVSYRVGGLSDYYGLVKARYRSNKGLLII
mgnify:CR=1 FL=1